MYFFFKFAYPRDLGGSAFLETPTFLKHYFPEEGAGRAGMNGAFGEAPASRQAAQADNRPAWGRGRTLGD
jgi:Derlin-1